MLETIRQFAEEQLVQTGEADEARTTHAHYFAERGSRRHTRCGTVRDSARPTTWFTVELANLRTAFRWAADHGDLDAAATIAVYATLPRIVERTVRTCRLGRGTHRACARPSNIPGLAQLYVAAAQCYSIGGSMTRSAMPRLARQAIESGRFDEVPYEFEAALSGAYTTDRAARKVGCVVPQYDCDEGRALISSRAHAWFWH